MMVEFKYAGSSAIVSGLKDSRVAFATNQLREATFFEGELGRPLVFREALGALYDVVVSDYKYHPKDRLAFKAWLEQQDQKFLDSLAKKKPEVEKRIEEIEARLGELNIAREALKQPFYSARHAFFEYLYENQYELQYIFDPVITVHPDELSFEAFSRDESSYGRLAAKHDLFGRIDSFECGTTNVDFGVGLHQQLDRMRSYRQTRFTIDPTGFAVHHAGDASGVKEKKIDLPESWMQGFLQVHAVMSMGLTRLRLMPIDVFNIVRFLKQHKAKASPRSLRWELKPGKPARIFIEPWDYVLELSKGAIHEGPKEQTIRTWGRDRLRVLERLIPVTEKVDVYLAGTGLPSLWVMDLGDLIFTLGLSGWTDNDWTGGMAKFDLLTQSVPPNAEELTAVYEKLRLLRYANEAKLAQESQLSVEKIRTSLSMLCRGGRAMKDLAGNVFRHRDLLYTPFKASEILALAKKEGEEKDPKAKIAKMITEQGDVRIIARRPFPKGYKLSGSAKGPDGSRVRPMLTVDHEGQILEAACSCDFGKKHGLTKGPCEHMLALRLAHMKKLESEAQ